MAMKGSLQPRLTEVLLQKYYRESTIAKVLLWGGCSPKRVSKVQSAGLGTTTPRTHPLRDSYERAIAKVQLR